ncbi:MAG: phosphate signaling complex protein PhoU [Candidatus Omnitrophica bacterium]|nr:phosphate signaling complex protein PhoU [Candidatus Omnitrophota bacterium]
MERYIDDELKQLNTDLIKMATLTEEAIYRSVEALVKQDKDMAQKVIDDDNKIDELELVVEERAIELLACQQPVGFDLRFVATSIKINAEIERIADLAVNISQRVLDIAGEPPLKPLDDIPRLAEVARWMVRGTIDAFVNRDEALAKKVIYMDPEADKLRNAIQEELLFDHMMKDGTCAPRALPLYLIARHLERICDHATYIAEDVIFMVRAKQVKHHLEELDGNSG